MHIYYIDLLIIRVRPPWGGEQHNPKEYSGRKDGRQTAYSNRLAMVARATSTAAPVMQKAGPAVEPFDLAQGRYVNRYPVDGNSDRPVGLYRHRDFDALRPGNGLRRARRGLRRRSDPFEEVRVRPVEAIAIDVPVE